MELVDAIRMDLTVSGVNRQAFGVPFPPDIILAPLAHFPLPAVALMDENCPAHLHPEKATHSFDPGFGHDEYKVPLARVHPTGHPVSVVDGGVVVVDGVVVAVVVVVVAVVVDVVVVDVEDFWFFMMMSMAMAMQHVHMTTIMMRMISMIVYHTV